MDWPAAWAALRLLDDDAWDAESERLDALWCEEYCQEFVRYALSRKGWERENARVWCDEIVADALIEHRGSPVEAARKDVIECELETP